MEQLERLISGIDGLGALVKLLRGEIVRQGSTLLIVDGLLTARWRAETTLDTQKFISELQGHAAFVTRGSAGQVVMARVWF